MAAWTHTQYWTKNSYADCRNFVKQNARNFEGDTRDCADLSLLLLIKFAATHQLPVTFFDATGLAYLSKSSQPWPMSKFEPYRHDLTWNNEQEYTDNVRRRINASMLLKFNTEENPKGPEVGDLMIKKDKNAKEPD